VPALTKMVAAGILVLAPDEFSPSSRQLDRS
jgi:hypothetical protein